MADMAERELMILLKLQNHNNIVKIIDYVLEEDSFWIFMEFCDLGDLGIYLEEHSRMTLLAKVKILSLPVLWHTCTIRNLP